MTGSVAANDVNGCGLTAYTGSADTDVDIRGAATAAKTWMARSEDCAITIVLKLKRRTAYLSWPSTLMIVPGKFFPKTTESFTVNIAKSQTSRTAKEVVQGRTELRETEFSNALSGSLAGGQRVPSGQQVPSGQRVTGGL